MVCGKVTGTIVSTRKVETLVGSKFLEVELYRNGAPTGDFLVAIDRGGAGIGERVLITRGSGARLALDDRETPTDAVIVGIIDE